MVSECAYGVYFGYFGSGSVFSTLSFSQQYLTYRRYDKGAEPYKAKTWLSLLEKYPKCYTKSFPKDFISHIVL
jgi:hypothetical protein